MNYLPKACVSSLSSTNTLPLKNCPGKYKRLVLSKSMTNFSSFLDMTWSKIKQFDMVSVKNQPNDSRRPPSTVVINEKYRTVIITILHYMTIFAGGGSARTKEDGAPNKNVLLRASKHVH